MTPYVLCSDRFSVCTTIEQLEAAAKEPDVVAAIEKMKAEDPTDYKCTQNCYLYYKAKIQGKFLEKQKSLF